MAYFWYTIRRKKAKIYAVIGCLLLIFAFFITIILQAKIAPFTEYLAKSKAQYTANKIINETIAECIMEEKVGYSDLYILEKDENGNIKAETSNIVGMNNFKSKIHGALNEKFGNIKNSTISIPIGSLTNLDWFANHGPSIPVRLIFNGNIAMDFTNSFTSAGINQTKHSSALVTKTEIMIMLAGRTSVYYVENTIPIAETIILGDVPNSYLNFDFPK
ncbi:sporulation protein YunB [Clostridia bacterium]|nr:sporulation protein YunB [Clostridia bacterium]